MLRQVLYAKIHRAVVTDSNPDYMGSVTIDPVLLEATGMVINERILVADCETGQRFETYIFEGRRGSGEVVINGAAAHKTAVGHHVLIMSFAAMEPREMREHRPRVAICDRNNRVAELLRYDPAPAETAAASESSGG